MLMGVLQNMVHGNVCILVPVDTPLGGHTIFCSTPPSTMHVNPVMRRVDKRPLTLNSARRDDPAAQADSSRVISRVSLQFRSI